CACISSPCANASMSCSVTSRHRAQRKLATRRMNGLPGPPRFPRVNRPRASRPARLGHGWHGVALAPFPPFIIGDSEGHGVALAPFPPFINGDNRRHGVACSPFPPFLIGPANTCRPAEGSPFGMGGVFMAAAPKKKGVRSVVGWVCRVRSDGLQYS